MGFCCICCEVMYLALFILHIPHYQQLWLIPVQLPESLQQWAAGTCLQGVIQGSRGLPVVGLVALLAVPGVAVKQVCNWVQLQTAIQGLVDHDVKKAS